MVEPLTIGEIVDKIHCKSILYEDMANIDSINQLMPQTLILYQLAFVGHFCCVFINDEGINFFDPIGQIPDDSLKYVRMDIPNHDFTYLLELLSHSNLPVIYNEHRYQKNDSNTCGYWCTIRMIFSYLTNDEFYDIFKPIKLKDNKIVKLYNLF